MKCFVNGVWNPTRDGTDSAQREALEAEDVEVRVGGGAGANEFLIDLVAYRWFPIQVSWNGAGDPIGD